MKKALKANSTTARPRIMLDPGRAAAIVVHSGLPAPDASRGDGPPTRARRKDVDRAGQAASSRSDPPTAQRLDRQDNRERSGHSEDVESPDEQQRATLLEKLRAQAIPHVQGQHRGGHHAAK